METTRRDLENQLIARAWEDEAFKAELQNNPTAVIRRELQALGITLPDGVSVVVHEETATDLHLVLPLTTKMTAESSELSDADLDLVAGGSTGEEGNTNECAGSA